MNLKIVTNTFCLTLLTLVCAHATPGFAQSGPGSYGNIKTAYSCSRDEDVINLRVRPGQQYQILRRIPSGKAINLVGNTRVVGEFTWQKVNYAGTVGWIRGDFLCN
jgi:uncharacterized protein YgiM (DUF1202 family)